VATTVGGSLEANGDFEATVDISHEIARSAEVGRELESAIAAGLRAFADGDIRIEIHGFANENHAFFNRDLHDGVVGRSRYFNRTHYGAARVKRGLVVLKHGFWIRDQAMENIARVVARHLYGGLRQKIRGGECGSGNGTKSEYEGKNFHGASILEQPETIKGPRKANSAGASSGGKAHFFFVAAVIYPPRAALDQHSGHN